MLGTIAGFVPDGERVAAAIRRHEPQKIAIGVPEPDLEALSQLVAEPELADELEPDDMDLHFLALIEHWGATHAIPSPDLAAAHASEIPLVAVDLDDDGHTTLFTQTVKLRHLVQRGSVRKKLEADTGETADDAYHQAQLWDEALCKIKPLKVIEDARSYAMAEGIKVAADCERIVAVVPAARYESVLSNLSHPS